jgi:ammonium transporter
MDSIHSSQDILWVLICAVLVLLMQAGFCCLESGLVRSKNSLNVAIKNFSDFCVSAFLFWSFGFAIMFGLDYQGLIGTTGFTFGETGTSWDKAFFIYQVMFCGTAVTIISGSVAERLRFSGYLIMVVIVSSLIYPLFGHWAWSGVQHGTPDGWLASRGFLDFAGSTVVHSVGGWVALAAIIIIGPRAGRFGTNKVSIKKHSMPIATLGVFLLWFGWFGFNGGSTLAITDQIPNIFINTTLAGLAGGLAGLGLSWRIFLKPKAEDILNGVLAGLVGITASCNLVSPAEAILIGAVGGAICLGATRLLENMGFDDVVAAVPVHSGGGVWGTLALALFGDPAIWGTGLGRWDQFLIQLTGVGVCFIWSFGVGFALLWLVNRWYPLRVSAKEERVGLDIAEHSFEQLTAKIQKDEALIAAMVDNINDGIITVDQQGVIETFNPAAERMFGLSSDKINGKHISILVQSADENMDENTFLHSIFNTDAQAVGSKEIQARGRRKNGVIFPLEISANVMNLEGHVLFVCIFRDITERKWVEEELTNYRSRLEELVTKRTDELNITNQLLHKESSYIQLNKDIAVTANQTHSLKEAMRFSLECICKASGWPVGHVYFVSDISREKLIPGGIWYLEDPPRFETFRKITDTTSFEMGIGLPGRVLESGRPAWVIDVTQDANFPRAKVAEDIGVRGGFAFPILINLEVVGVMEFFSPESAEPDEKLLEIMGNVGTLLGRVAERKRAEDALKVSETRTRTIVKNTIDGIITINDSGIIGSFNPAAEGIFGYEALEVVGKNVSVLMPEPDKSGHDGYLHNYLDSGIPKIIGRGREVTGARKDGSTFPLDLAVSEMVLDKERLFIGIMRDITERKRVEKELIEAKEVALRASAAKSQFLSNMSHELRTPLNGVLGFADLLIGQMGGSLNAKQLSYVNQIDYSGKHLLDLINDLLDMAKIDAGIIDLNLEAYSPKECMASVTGLIQPQIDKKKIALNTFLDPNLDVLACDRKRMKQIMLNLLSNAIKYTPEQGEIEIRFLKEASGARVLISDTGIGIEKEQLEHIFDEFHQVDRKRDEALGGAGIGLALSRRLVEMHGGSIGVESEKGKGSTFWFIIPHNKNIAPEGKAPDNTSEAVPMTQSIKHKILVVEDNEVNLAMVLEMLTLNDFEVFVARNGQEGVDLAKSCHPDLILMDIRMPVMDGLEATKLIKKMSQFANTPVIALTASAGEEDKESCLSAGCEEHVAKPIQSKELLELIGRYL